MQRGVTGSILAVAAALLLGACGTPAGIDGQLVNDWKAMTDAAIPVPPTGACYNESAKDPASVTKWSPPVECTAAHTVETVFVGTLTGEDAERSAPPGPGSTGRRTAYERCMSEANAYFGDDWRTGRLGLFLTLPIDVHWQAGARSYRCDVVEYENLDDYPIVSRTASVRNALIGDRPVGLSCVTVTVKSDGRVDKKTPTDCGARHNGEFAGVFDLPDGPYPTDAAAASKARLDGCGKVVAQFVDVPNDADLQNRIGWIASPFGELEWQLGNRGVRCYAYTSEGLTGTIKNAGVERLPVD